MTTTMMKVDSMRQRTTSSSSSSHHQIMVGRKRGVPSQPPLQMISEDQQEFEMCVGHAMDVLRSDYPEILNDNPDFSIYDPNLELIDPS
eukprot:CAMPEP_0117014044 /NCGR_PEP_ID=MMETSP0472-20121206/11472_1 /TAXON_ID=693140 ORGANISM="Tiarina fusus, Strain LIS" /NCGR_SAMPLE_ID=MMETSP0472 /ASSEMBLY_ACC=CAM_ASM_000603 /LENGTH=88 /DNA_ID=CAMNT_0004717515 /DNA_START=331 /DNA_END=593 /DNA_ORIENTATION=+